MNIAVSGAGIAGCRGNPSRFSSMYSSRTRQSTMLFRLSIETFCQCAFSSVMKLIRAAVSIRPHELEVKLFPSVSKRWGILCEAFRASSDENGDTVKSHVAYLSIRLKKFPHQQAGTEPELSPGCNSTVIRDGVTGLYAFFKLICIASMIDGRKVATGAELSSAE